MTLHFCIALLLLKMAITKLSMDTQTHIGYGVNTVRANPTTRHTQATTLLMAFMHPLKPLRVPAKASTSMLLCVALAGDVKINPGPRPPKFHCGICKSAVRSTDPKVCCDQCNKWVHNKCSSCLKACMQFYNTAIVCGFAHMWAAKHYRHILRSLRYR